MKNQIILVSKKDEIKHFFPNEKIVFVDVENVYNYIQDRNIIILHDIQMNLKLYNVFVEKLSNSQCVLFGIDVNFDNDITEIDEFEHVFQSNTIDYIKTQKLTPNVSFIPSFPSKINNNYIVGILGDDSIISQLHNYENIQYVNIDESNINLYGCDSIIISGKIDVKFMVSVLISCKPYIIYSEKEPHTLHNFLLNNLSWGQQYEKDNSEKWWKQMHKLLTEKSQHVKYPKIKYVNSEIIDVLSKFANFDVSNWFYGKEMFNENNNICNTVTFAKLVSVLKTKQIDKNITKNIIESIENKTIIDVSSINSTLKQEYIKPIINKPSTFINLDPYLSCYTNRHRSGWKYVVNNLASLHRHNRNNIIFDSCIDQTFLWGSDVLKELNKIPYTTPWTGIIHHTFSEYCGINNCNNLFNSPEFIESLKHCKCLITLSKYLAEQIKDALPTQFKDIPVEFVKHPTMFLEMNKTFNPTFFDYTITHIGNFLRNKESFNKINVNQWKKQMLKNDPSSSLSNDISINNNSKHTVFNENIDIINFLSNEDYDSLLIKTVVFIDLFDASACNTLIECIVRNTPIIVNNHPAVVEYIGADYPGLYTDLEEVNKLCNIDSVNNMYNYLASNKEIKNDINIKTFITDIDKILFKTSTL